MDITPWDILANNIRLATFVIGLCSLFFLVRRMMRYLRHVPRARPAQPRP